MPFGIYVSVGGIARKARKLYVGDDSGTAKLAETAYIGIPHATPPRSGQAFFVSGARPIILTYNLARKIKEG